MRKITFLAMLLCTTFNLFAIEGGTLTANLNPIPIDQDVTLSYDGTSTNFAQWQPTCYINAWLTPKDGETFSQTYSNMSECNGDDAYALLDDKLKMTYGGAAGQYSITINIANFFHVTAADMTKVGQLNVVVRAQWTGDMNTTNTFTFNVDAPTSTSPMATLSLAYNYKVNTTVTLAATSLNIENPTYIYSVIVPGDSIYEVITTPTYTFNNIGVYSVKVEALANGAGVAVASDVMDINIEEKYYVAGNGANDTTGVWCNGLNWDAAGSYMDGDSIVFENVPAGTWSFKITNGTWDYSWGYTDVDLEHSSLGIKNNNGNIEITTTQTQDIKITFNGTKICLIGNFKISYYVAGNGTDDATGSWCNGVYWDAAGAYMDGDSIVFENVPAGTWSFKITNGTWNYNWGYESLNAECSSDGVENNGGNIQINTTYTQNIKITFDGTNICVIGDFGELVITSYTLIGDAAFVGIYRDVNYIANDMIETSTGVYELTKEGMTLDTLTYSYQVVGNHSYFAYESPYYTCKITEAGTYNLTFTFTVATETATVNAQKTINTALDLIDADKVYAQNGTIYANGQFRIFTITGIDVTAQNGNLKGIYLVQMNNGSVTKVLAQ